MNQLQRKAMEFEPDQPVGRGGMRPYQGELLSRRQWLRDAAVAGTTFLLAPESALHGAENARIRLATLAPKDSSFHKSLQEMGEKWRRASNGAVSLIIYTDGTMGGESDMVRRMQIGQLQAAMLTVNGLMRIDDTVSALQNMPMVFASLAEYDYVREKLRPIIEQRMLAKGYVMLFWGDAGWVRFFSKKPAVRPADFKNVKIFIGVGDTRTTDIMKALGFNPVPLEQTDILSSLETGLIEAVPSVPFYALAGQFYGPAPHMVEVNWAPLVGGTVVTKKAWDTIPASLRPALLKAAAEAGAKIQARSRAEAEESVAAMKKRGLHVHKLTPEAEAEWKKLAEEVLPLLRGKIVPPDMFDEVRRLVKEYRATKGTAQP